MSLPLRDLMRILAVAEHGSVSGAARSLYVAQPALSRTLHATEAYLGMPLFVRTTTGMETTDAGEALVSHARAIRAELERAERSVDAVREGRQRRVVIGVPEVPPLELTSSAILRTSQALPGVLLQVAVGSTDVLLDRLVQAEVDFLFAPLPDKPLDPTLVETVVYVDDAIVACGRTCRLFRTKRPQLEQLARERWVVGPPGSVSHNLLLDFCRLHGLPRPTVSLEAENVPFRRQAVLRSDLLSVFYRAQVRSWLDDRAIRTLPFDWPNMHQRVGTIRSSASTTAVHDVFLASMRAALAGPAAVLRTR